MNQRTLAKSITSVGIGLHSGRDVTITFEPAQADSGINFLRTDIANSPLIPADAFLVNDTVMSSNLGVGDIKIGTVEHLLSALAGLGIDNLLIKVSDIELPILDGSSAPYAELLLEGGVKELNAPKRFLKILKNIKVVEGDKWAQLTPYDGFRLEFKIDFDHPAIPKDTQFYSFDFSTKKYIKSVSNARTFGFLHDIERLKESNLALGGSLDNAIVMDECGVINEDGLRHKNELVRHKLLDAVGDLYLAKYPLLAKFSAYKSGHELNNRLIRSVYSDPNNFEIVTFYDKDSASINYDLPKSSLYI